MSVPWGLILLGARINLPALPLHLQLKISLRFVNNWVLCIQTGSSTDNEDGKDSKQIYWDAKYQPAEDCCEHEFQGAGEGLEDGVQAPQEQACHYAYSCVVYDN